MNESERSQLKTSGYLKTQADGVCSVLTGEMLNTVELHKSNYVYTLYIRLSRH